MFDFDFGDVADGIGDFFGGSENNTGNNWESGVNSSLDALNGWDWDGIANGIKSGFKTFNDMGGSNLVKGGLAAYDMYNRNKTAKALMPQINALNSMYQPGSPEAKQMKREMEARDAAAGRRSQYGPRANELAASLAKNRSQILTSPGYMNLQSAYAANKYGGGKGLADLFGSFFPKNNFADGGLVGGTGADDESSIQWKGTESGLGSQDFSFLSQFPMMSSAGNDGDIQFAKSWKFDDGTKQMPNKPTLPNEAEGWEPTDESLNQMASNAGFDPTAEGLANVVTGQGEGNLADFWSQGGDLNNATELGAAGMQKQWLAKEKDFYNDYQNFVNQIGSNRYSLGVDGVDFKTGLPKNELLRNEALARNKLASYQSARPEGVKPAYKVTPYTSAYGNAASWGLNKGLSNQGWVPGPGAGYNGLGGASGGGATGSIGGLNFGGFSSSGGSNLNGYIGKFGNGADGSLADGGKVPGYDPHNTDDFKANLTRGEYVLPVDVVDKIGVENLDKLVDMFHRPTGR